jgi:hypothetical protein
MREPPMCPARTVMESVPGFWQPWWSDKTIDEAIRSSERLAFVWEGNHQILAFVCAHDLGFRAYLSELVVDAGIPASGHWKPLGSCGRGSSPR